MKDYPSWIDDEIYAEEKESALSAIFASAILIMSIAGLIIAKCIFS